MWSRGSEIRTADAKGAILLGSGEGHRGERVRDGHLGARRGATHESLWATAALDFWPATARTAGAAMDMVMVAIFFVFRGVRKGAKRVRYLLASRGCTRVKARRSGGLFSGDDVAVAERSRMKKKWDSTAVERGMHVFLVFKIYVRRDFWNFAGILFVISALTMHTCNSFE